MRRRRFPRIRRIMYITQIVTPEISTARRRLRAVPRARARESGDVVEFEQGPECRYRGGDYSNAHLGHGPD